MHEINSDFRLITIWLSVFEILSMEKSDSFAPYMGIEAITDDLRQIAQQTVRFWYENYQFRSTNWWRAFRNIAQLDKQIARAVYNFGRMFLENHHNASAEITQWSYFFERLVGRRPGNQLLDLSKYKKRALKNAYIEYKKRRQDIFLLAAEVIKLPLSEWEQFLYANYKGGNPINLPIGQSIFWNQVNFWQEITNILSQDELKRLEEWAALIVDRFKFNFDRKPKIISFENNLIRIGG